MKRIFWSLNSVIAGLLIGYGLFMITSDVGNQQFGFVMSLVGVSHFAISFWGYRRFVGRGLFFQN